jgi:hypothetical protein
MFSPVARLATLASLLSLPAHAGSEWSGDFETKEITQWSSCQAREGTSNRLTVVPAEAGRSGYALRVLVKVNDAPVRSRYSSNWAAGVPRDRCYRPSVGNIDGGWRAEVVHKPDEPEEA